jgi:hypothetical protein
MDDYDWDKIAEAIPQTEIEFHYDFFKQYDSLDENHPDYETLVEIYIYCSVYEGGEKEMLLHALRLSCELKQLAFPNFVAQRVRESLLDWSELEVRTLDEAFNVEKPKNFHLKASRVKESLSPKIYMRVKELHKNGESIDVGMFERVGEEVGLRGTATNDYYYEYKRLIEAALEHISNFRK